MSGREWVPYAEEQTEYQIQPSLQVTWGSTEYISMRAVPVEDYEGPYNAVPSWNDQTFDTADKYMAEDFSVNSILELEVANDAGGLTLTI